METDWEDPDTWQDPSSFYIVDKYAQFDMGGTEMAPAMHIMGEMNVIPVPLVRHHMRLDYSYQASVPGQTPITHTFPEHDYQSAIGGVRTKVGPVEGECVEDMTLEGQAAVWARWRHMSGAPGLVRYEQETEPANTGYCPEPSPDPPPGGGADPIDPCENESLIVDGQASAVAECLPPGMECHWEEYGLFVWYDGQWWLVETWWEYECNESLFGDDGTARGSPPASLALSSLADSDFVVPDAYWYAILDRTGELSVFLRESLMNDAVLATAVEDIERVMRRTELADVDRGTPITVRSGRRMTSKPWAARVLTAWPKLTGVLCRASPEGEALWPALLLSTSTRARFSAIARHRNADPNGVPP